MRTFVPVPRLWPGSTVACLGTGPSLTLADVEYLRGRARIIAVNDAYNLAFWADAMYSADQKFWKWAHTNYQGRHPDFPHFTGMKFGIEPVSWPGVHVLRHERGGGLATDPAALRSGHNSGYQSIGLARHFGAVRILLLGFDMHGDHFFGSHPDKSVPPFTASLSAFQTLVQPLRSEGIEVVNCTPKSALRWFPMHPLREVLPAHAALETVQ